MKTTERFASAFRFAESLHRQQSRKTTNIPYISHLMAVAALTIEDAGSEDEAIAALLHDSIEDQGDDYPGGRAALRSRVIEDFGQDVLDIVNAVTDDEGHSKASATPDAEGSAWKARKQEYLDHLRRVEDRRILRVSCADKLHNARTILCDYRELGESLWQRFRTKSRDDQMWVYRGLCEVFIAKGVGRLAEDLRITLDQIEAMGSRR